MKTLTKKHQSPFPRPFSEDIVIMKNLIIMIQVIHCKTSNNDSGNNSNKNNS